MKRIAVPFTVLAVILFTIPSVAQGVYIEQPSDPPPDAVAQAQA